MILIPPLEEICDCMGDVVNGGARKPLRIQKSNGSSQIGASFLEISRRTIRYGNDSLEEVGNAVARPRVGNRHRTSSKPGASEASPW
jgi:hypothetical protein